ncbi:MAG: hypothetical protein ACJARO_002032, partial [Bacteriovoracaceae bacterium]
MPNNEYDFPVGVDYSNLPSPFGGENGSARSVGEFLEWGENNLTPYVGIMGGDIYSDATDATNHGGIKRAVINVAPLNNSTFPNDGKDWSMINIDSAQLYSTQSNGEYGRPYAKADKDSPKCEPFWWEKREDAGAYKSPVPMPGLPLKLQKVYFCATAADSKKGHSIGASSRYFSYFACSNPIEQLSIQERDDCDEDPGTVYNPRDNNFALQNGIETSWEDINICSSGGGGGGGGGCDSFNLCVETSGILQDGNYLTGSGITTGIITADDPCFECTLDSAEDYSDETSYDAGACVSDSENTYISLREDNSGIPLTDDYYWEKCQGLREDPCTKTLVFSGCHIEVEDIAILKSGCSGSMGSLIKFNQPPPLVSYAYETGSGFLPDILSSSGECCDPFIVFSGCGITVDKTGCGSIVSIPSNNVSTYAYETGSGFVSGIVSGHDSAECCDPFIIFSGCDITVDKIGCGSIVGMQRPSPLSIYAYETGSGFLSGILSGHGGSGSGSGLSECCDPFVIYSGCVTVDKIGCGSIVGFPHSTGIPVYSFNYSGNDNEYDENGDYNYNQGSNSSADDSENIN